MKIRLGSAPWMTNSQEQQNVLRNKLGFDGVIAVKALRLYFEFCKLNQVTPNAACGRSDMDDIEAEYYCASVEFGKEGMPVMETFFTEGLASLLTCYEDKILNVLLKVYKITGLPASVIIPKFVEASKSGAGLKDLLGIVQNLAVKSVKPSRRV